jgi:hypothetical protein
MVQGLCALWSKSVRVMMRELQRSVQQKLVSDSQCCSTQAPLQLDKSLAPKVMALH